MSSRISSDFGSLGDRTGGTARGPAAATEEGRTRWVEVDDGRWLPGVLVSWSHSPGGWLALVAWVDEERLTVATVPSTRVRPVRRAVAPTPYKPHPGP
ncbi:hypothetical protein [Raineyella fluvialis]|uniref:Uncharacterized protein n=1 Tax=Raineyella fluvialis TaxID=2662261 RepID=A0A5Q2FD80_9ACTN|nr:hypothetical protein [Raineyella fluvialis]QGF24758.1 hypothetical protein Rai3103_15240 [Raineyella fluvialis]